MFLEHGDQRNIQITAAPVQLPRETIAHIKVQGYDIPPKTHILVNAWAIGRDPKYWTNPKEFNSERFIDSPVDYKGRHFELLPIGSGRMICPGITIRRAPDGMTHEDIDKEEAGTLTVVKKVPLNLVPVRVQ
ncbi:PREDICTED: cytochrome P450 71B16-like [Camelina sativa]|uniref:Cytochrome P450 71B16-like n=1 Tax=Camelina sativa TaxID=90675 RepID=A0ABM0YWN9_CAMSA|nr:PREDICTED: cytochrome P450 71B16-like [Camelina sativa]